MRSPASGENAKPWSPSSPAEAALDIVTLGATRRERERRVRAHYASLDEDRLRGYVTSHEVTPRPLSNLLPSARAKGIAQLALAVVYSAKTIHINTFQGYQATVTRGTDGERRVSSCFSGSLHDPTLYRVREATGRDYLQDLRNAHTLVALMMHNESSVDIEGIGRVANEYQDHSTKTGRVTDATFLIQGLPAATAEQFAGSLHQHPAETLDGVIYTAFADAGLPGRSLLQTPPVGQHADSLFIPEACNEVTVVTVPAQ